MTNSSFLKKLFLALIVVLLVSCDKDFNELGSDIIDDDIHHDMTGETIGVVAYTAPLGGVQSNNLTINQLGVFNSDVFGKTIAHFVTQLEMPNNATNPVMFSPVVDSVYLYVPYYSKKTQTEASGVSLYKLDSVYGDTEAVFDLKVYRNGYFLRDSDPSAPSGVQRYYSDDKAMVDALKVGSKLNDDANKDQNIDFKVSAKEIERKVKDKVVERLAPGIFMNLNIDAIKSQIIDAAKNGNLLNNNVFKNYFRGLYFNVEQKNGGAVMVVPQFSKGTITIKYRDKEVGIDGLPTANIINKTITLNLTGNTINFYDNTIEGTPFESGLAAVNPSTGDSRLYVKGGAGSMAVINIDQTAINDLIAKSKASGILVNEANLSFFIDKEVMKNSKKEPMRVYLYDLKNKTPIFDYYRDASTNNINKKYDKIVHGGIIEYDISGDKRGARYKIRLTNHLNNIIKNDSLNVPLGLVVTEDINVVSMGGLKTPFTDGIYNVNGVPVSSIVQPFGTVLFGNNLPTTDENYKNRLKLEIFYTKAK